ncbi:MAG: M28 family peptidase [Planctomycetia bacterium]|nr:M28 family peptidase [Planctomycetia bacterium]
MTRQPPARSVPPAAQKHSRQTWFLAVVAAIGLVIVGYIVLVDLPQRRSAAAPPGGRQRLADIPFDGQRAYENLKQICDLGPRPSGSPAMVRQRELLRSYFEKLGATVSEQTFRVRHPRDGSAVEMANMVVAFQPETKERFLVGVHYDTRPYPDQDPVDPRGRFVGANDGASGVALLMQLGEAVKDMKGRYGVDFVFFDGEEFVFREGDPYFRGSNHFAEEYVANPPGHAYRQGVVLDMIGDKDLQLFEEGNSVDWPPSRAVVNAIWSTAKKLGVREFIARRGHTVNDDHLALCQKAKIPTCDVIDFDYPHWHTQGDTADKCSALSLAKVGWVIEEWLRRGVR